MPFPKCCYRFQHVGLQADEWEHSVNCCWKQRKWWEIQKSREKAATIDISKFSCPSLNRHLWDFCWSIFEIYQRDRWKQWPEECLLYWRAVVAPATQGNSSDWVGLIGLIGRTLWKMGNHQQFWTKPIQTKRFKGFRSSCGQFKPRDSIRQHLKFGVVFPSRSDQLQIMAFLAVSDTFIGVASASLHSERIASLLPLFVDFPRISNFIQWGAQRGGGRGFD